MRSVALDLTRPGFTARLNCRVPDAPQQTTLLPSA
jgi:hypothetical protein